MQSDVNVEVIPTSMPHEMRNNGTNFKLTAQNETDFYLKIKDQIFSIISYTISYESMVNLFIADKLSKLPHLNKEQAYILRYLTVNSNKNTPVKLRNIYKKLSLLESIYGLKHKSLQTVEFKEFDEKVIKLRNKIVHFSHAGHNEIYGQDCTDICNKGDILLTDAVKSLCKILGEKLPSYYQNYIPIKG